MLVVGASEAACRLQYLGVDCSELADLQAMLLEEIAVASCTASARAASYRLLVDTNFTDTDSVYAMQ